jgi:hypothetical protein
LGVDWTCDSEDCLAILNTPRLFASLREIGLAIPNTGPVTADWTSDSEDSSNWEHLTGDWTCDPEDWTCQPENPVIVLKHSVTFLMSFKKVFIDSIVEGPGEVDM